MHEDVLQAFTGISGTLFLIMTSAHTYDSSLVQHASLSGLVEKYFDSFVTIDSHHLLTLLSSRASPVISPHIWVSTHECFVDNIWRLLHAHSTHSVLKHSLTQSQNVIYLTYTSLLNETAFPLWHSVNFTVLVVIDLQEVKLNHV